MVGMATRVLKIEQGSVAGTATRVLFCELYTGGRKQDRLRQVLVDNYDNSYL